MNDVENDILKNIFALARSQILGGRDKISVFYLYVLLVSFSHEKGGKFFISHAKIHELTGLAEHTIINASRKLVQLKLIEIEQGGIKKEGVKEIKLATTYIVNPMEKWGLDEAQKEMLNNSLKSFMIKDVGNGSVKAMQSIHNETALNAVGILQLPHDDTAVTAEMALQSMQTTSNSIESNRDSFKEIAVDFLTSSNFREKYEISEDQKEPVIEFLIKCLEILKFKNKSFFSPLTSTIKGFLKDNPNAISIDAVLLFLKSRFIKGHGPGVYLKLKSHIQEVCEAAIPKQCNNAALNINQNLEKPCKSNLMEKFLTKLEVKNEI